MKEEGRNEDPTKAYSYEATKIELLGGQSGSPESLPRNSNNSISEIELMEGFSGTPHTQSADFVPTSNNSISAAKLLKNVEKSYDKGKKLLDESGSKLEESGVRFRNLEESDRVVDISDAGTRPLTDRESGRQPRAADGKERSETRQREGEEGEAERGDWYDRGSKRQEESARRRFEEAAEKMHLGDRVQFAETIDEVEGLTKRQREAQRRKKGWFDPRTGKIVIILGNHRSMDDVMKSIMHEGVAHYGLRQLFGEHFDRFLDNVYESASVEIRAKIVEMAERHGWDFRTATVEYLATLAETTEFERPENQSWWRQVKARFFEMLHKLGFELDYWYGTLTDNELRYILWRSYENLVNPGRQRSLVEEAKDVAVQYELGVGEWGQAWQAAESAPSGRYSMWNGRRVPLWATEGGETARQPRSAAEGVNARFNEELEKLTEENAREVLLDCAADLAIYYCRAGSKTSR